MTDPIADYLTKVRSTNMAKYGSVKISASTVKKSFSGILKQEDLIRDCKVTDDNKQGMIKIFSEYGPNGEHVISDLRKISKPGLRGHVGAGNLPKVLSGLGIAIVSASADVITGKEAREKNVGSEVLAYVR